MIYVIIYAVSIVVSAAVGYFVGSKNPWKKVAANATAAIESKLGS